MTTHGALSESSVSYRVVTHDRKGREGKGREILAHALVVTSRPYPTNGCGPQALTDACEATNAD